MNLIVMPINICYFSPKLAILSENPDNMTLATLITLSRLPVLGILVALLFVPVMAWRLFGLGLLIVLFLMDWFDG